MSNNQLGQDFADLKKAVREIPEIKSYLDSYSVTVGNIVFARRRQLGFTQGELADLVGTKQGRISEIESGSGNVTMDVMNRVFQVLKLVGMNPIFIDDQAASMVKEFSM